MHFIEINGIHYDLQNDALSDKNFVKHLQNTGLAKPVDSPSQVTTPEKSKSSGKIE